MTTTSHGSPPSPRRGRRQAEPPSSAPAPAPAPGPAPASVRRTALRVVGVLAVLGLCAAAWAVPGVRGVLRDSFTEREQSYIELYFSDDPWFDGTELVVPLDLVEHGESGGRRVVEVKAEDDDGRSLASGTGTVTTKPGALMEVDVRLRLKGAKKRAADAVEVTLRGHPQRLRLHLR